MTTCIPISTSLIRFRPKPDDSCLYSKFIFRRVLLANRKRKQLLHIPAIFVISRTAVIASAAFLPSSRKTGGNVYSGAITLFRPLVYPQGCPPNKKKRKRTGSSSRHDRNLKKNQRQRQRLSQRAQPVSPSPTLLVCWRTVVTRESAPPIRSNSSV